VANLQDIRRRITTVSNTQKITSAMRMVSAAKLRRAQAAIEAARPYAERMRSTLEEVAAGQAQVEHPLLEEREQINTLEVVVVTSDRGLAGAFNNNVLKRADAVLKEREAAGVRNLSLTLIGKKAGDYYRRRRPEQIREAEPVGVVSYTKAAEIAHRLARSFAEGEVDDVQLVYSEFVSTMNQKPRAVRLLPFSASVDAPSDAASPHTIEPSSERLLGTLVPKAIEVEVFRALLENQSGEHAARMAAMESATRNTEELIERLTLEYNRARQAAITKELVEIVTGAQALE
jgi:F-type H+-transporting ATPase subunit gamma